MFIVTKFRNDWKSARGQTSCKNNIILLSSYNKIIEWSKNVWCMKGTWDVISKAVDPQGFILYILRALAAKRGRCTELYWELYARFLSPIVVLRTVV